MKRRTKVILAVVGTVTVVGVGAAMMASKGGSEDDKARTVEVKRGDIIDKALAVGTIEPEVEISVKSKLSGVVSQEFADVGDFVRAGTPLLEIKPNPTPLELVDAKRQVEMKEIELDNLKKEIARQQALKEKGLVSEQEYESAQRRYAEAALQVQMARERLALLVEGRVKTASDQFETVVTSPIDGFILEKMVEVGDPVVPLSSYQEGTVLMTMADMKNLIFRGTVDEIDVGRLREGMPAEIKIGALPHSSIPGVLAKISLKAKKEDNAIIFPVEITLKRTNGTVLRAGYSANADIVIEKRENVLIIPERLVTFSGDTARVTVQLPDGSTEERIIETGLSDAINIEVISGLKEGELVLEKPPKEIE
jgi:HlyD family secretion protein